MEVVERPTLAQIFRRFFRRFRQESDLTREQRQAAWSIQACRTPQLGGAEYECEHCNQLHRRYNSCRHRSCPVCQAAKSYEWLEEQEERLLPVPYFHVVFTIPEDLHTVFRYNRKLLYGLLFKSSAQTLQTFAADPQWLGARLGFLGVLHTWGQQMVFHPHIHYVVPQGGLNAQGRWVSPQRRLDGKFLFPIKAVSRVFRGKLLSALEQLHRKGKLHFPDPPSQCSFPDRLRIAASKDWEVYAKRPFAGPEAVLRYLSVYTHRMVISTRRLLRMDAQEVQIDYKDYRDGGRHKTLRLRGVEFIKRFLQHVLPSGFRRIRYYGWMATRAGREHLVKVQAACLLRLRVSLAVLQQWADKAEAEPDQASEPTWPCPACGQGPMRWVRELEPVAEDTS